MTIAELIDDLVVTNVSLWHAEDRVREVTADAEVADLKRRIDGMNARRVELVEQIDEMLCCPCGREV